MTILEIVIDRSMTILETVIDQWHFWKLSLINDIFCKGAYMDRSRYLSKLSLIDQWQFSKVSLIDQWQFSQTPCPSMHLYKNCHWSINDNFLKHHVPLCTFTETVIDRSMTIFSNTMSLYAALQKLSLIGQWQFSKLSLIDQWQFQKLSLIDQWQFS